MSRCIVFRGKRGKITHTLHGLDEALVLGVLGPSSAWARARRDTRAGRAAVSAWLHAQEHVPLTPRNGIWYVVAYENGGQGIVGSLDCKEFH